MNADATPFSPEASEQLVESLETHFGKTWTWTEIAFWTLARANTGLPRWQVSWARDFVTNRRRSIEAAKPDPVDIATRRRQRR